MLIIVRGRMRVCRHRLSVSEFTFAQLRSIECFTHVRKMCDDKRESFLFFFYCKVPSNIQCRTTTCKVQIDGTAKWTRSFQTVGPGESFV